MVEEGEIDEVYKSDSDSAWSLRVPVAEDEDKFEVARGVNPRRELEEDRGCPQGDWTARGCCRGWACLSGCEATDDCQCAKEEGLSKLMPNNHDLCQANNK